MSSVANIKWVMMGLFKTKQHVAPTLPEGYRAYAIGDIHGCLTEFEELLELIEADNRERGPARTVLVLLGDLIDRGPDSSGVVRRAMTPLNWAQTVVLRGNHEAAMLDALDGDPQMLAIWLNNGGLDALRSWGMDRDSFKNADPETWVETLRAIVPKDQQRWLRNGKVSLHMGSFYFVHAGVRPGVPLLEQEDSDCLWIREGFLASNRDHGAVVVHGHSMADDIEEYPNRVGIDTGAYLSGKLTAIGLEGAERWFIQTQRHDNVWETGLRSIDPSQVESDRGANPLGADES